MDDYWERYKKDAIDVEFKKVDTSEEDDINSNDGIKSKYVVHLEKFGIYRLIDKVSMPQELKLFSYVLILLILLITLVAILLSWIRLLNKFIVNGGAFLVFLLMVDLLGIKVILKQSENKRHVPKGIFLISRLPLLILVSVPLPFIILGIINMFLI